MKIQKGVCCVTCDTINLVQGAWDCKVDNFVIGSYQLVYFLIENSKFILAPKEIQIKRQEYG